MRAPGGLWPWAVAAILGVGVGARLVQLHADMFSYDAYALMRGVDGPFAEYASGGAYIMTARLYYWVVHRLIGGELWCYVLPAVVVAVVTLLGVRLGLARAWPGRFELHAVVLGIMAFATHALHLARFPVITYGVSFGVGCWLFFVFLRLSERGFSRAERVGHGAVFALLGIFCNLTIVVPVAVGMTCAALMRLWRDAGTRSVRGVLALVGGMWPVLVLPAAVGAVQLAFPFTNLGYESRPDMRAYFFASSGFGDGGVLGAARFVVHGGLIMVLQAFRQSVDGVMTMRGGLFVLKILAGTCMGAAFAVALSRWRRGRLTPRAGFVWLYLVVYGAAIACGGLVGEFPYGNLRYADAMLLPMFLALATTFSPVQRMQPDMSRHMAGALCVLVAVAGLYLIKQNYESLTRTRDANRSVVRVVQKSGFRPVLYAAFQKPVLMQRAPELVRTGLPLGWGARYGEDEPDAEVAAYIATDPEQVVLLVPSRGAVGTTYGAYVELLQRKGYRLTKYKAAPNIWAGVFEVRDEDGAGEDRPDAALPQEDAPEEDDADKDDRGEEIPDEAVAPQSPATATAAGVDGRYSATSQWRGPSTVRRTGPDPAGHVDAAFPPEQAGTELSAGQGPHPQAVSDWSIPSAARQTIPQVGH